MMLSGSGGRHEQPYTHVGHRQNYTHNHSAYEQDDHTIPLFHLEPDLSRLADEEIRDAARILLKMSRQTTGQPSPHPDLTSNIDNENKRSHRHPHSIGLNNIHSEYRASRGAIKHPESAMRSTLVQTPSSHVGQAFVYNERSAPQSGAGEMDSEIPIYWLKTDKEQLMTSLRKAKSTGIVKFEPPLELFQGHPGSVDTKKPIAGMRGIYLQPPQRIDFSGDGQMASFANSDDGNAHQSPPSPLNAGRGMIDGAMDVDEFQSRPGGGTTRYTFRRTRIRASRANVGPIILPIALSSRSAGTPGRPTSFARLTPPNGQEPDVADLTPSPLSEDPSSDEFEPPTATPTKPRRPLATTLKRPAESPLASSSRKRVRFADASQIPIPNQSTVDTPTPTRPDIQHRNGAEPAGKWRLIYPPSGRFAYTEGRFQNGMDQSQVLKEVKIELKADPSVIKSYTLHQPRDWNSKAELDKVNKKNRQWVRRHIGATQDKRRYSDAEIEWLRCYFALHREELLKAGVTKGSAVFVELMGKFEGVFGGTGATAGRTADALYTYLMRAGMIGDPGRAGPKRKGIVVG